MIEPSPQQAAILEFIQTSSENLVVDAAPGSGKTTLLGMIGRILPEDGRRHVAVCFNKHSAEAFREKLPYWIESSTFHKLCKDAIVRSLLPPPKIFGDKCRVLLVDMMPEWHDRRAIQSDVLKLVGLLKQQADELTAEETEDLAEVYGIESSSRVVAISHEILALSDADRLHMDFDDMIRWAAELPEVRLPLLATVLLDEVQDTNAIQRKVLRRLIPPARLVAVGDPFQAIYAFRGADSVAMTAITEEFLCAVLPLSVSWRCSHAVIDEARKVLNSLQT